MVLKYGENDSIRIYRHNVANTNSIEIFELSDGRIATNTQLNQLIQSMASFESETGMLWNDAIAQNDENAISIIDNIWTQKSAM